MPRPDNGEEPLLSASEVQTGVVRAVGSIGIATLVSRILGFIRDMSVAHAFGAGLVTDAFLVAFRIPNLFRRLLAEGALSTAFVPIFTEYLTTRPREEFQRMVRSVMGAMLVVLVGATLLGVTVAPVIVRLMAPGFWADPGKAILAVRLTQMMFPYLCFIGLAALAMGLLNAHRNFFTPALGPTMLNIAMIASVFLLSPHIDPPIFGLAIGVLAGGLGQFLIQLPAVSRQGTTLGPTFDFSHPVLPRIGRLMTPTLFGMAVTQLNIFVDTILASLLPEGSVSYLYYADRIVEFPLGVFGIAVATAALPSMAAQAARQDLPGLKETLNFAIRLSCFVMVPASIGILLLRVPIVRLFFERGDFGPDATMKTAWALGFFAIGLVSFAGAKIVAQAFYSLGDVRTPVRLAVATMLLNILLNLLFMRWLAHGGLALATSCSSTVNFLGLLFFFRRHTGLIGGRLLLASVIRILAASLSFVPVVLFCLWVWPVGVSRWIDVVWLFLTIGASVAVYLAISFSMKGKEGPALLALLTRGRRLR